jgi:GAF domain-containing protein/anti-sigma regulatory factor (Ser/Thr protein kinase)
MTRDQADRGSEAEILTDLAGTLNESLDVDTVLQRVVQAATSLCGCDGAAIALPVPDTPAMAFRYLSDPEVAAHTAHLIEAGKGVGGKVLESGTPFRTEDYAGDLRITKDYLPMVRATGAVAMLAVPILIEGRVEGLLYVHHRTPGRPFTDRDEAILVRLAAHAAVALRNAQLFQRERARRREAEAVAEIGRVLAEGLDPLAIAQRIAHHARGLLTALAAVVYKVDTDSGDLIALAMSGDLGPAFAPGQTVARGSGATGQAVERRRTVASLDVLADPGVPMALEVRAWVEQAPYRAVVAVPLLVKGEAIGAVTVGDRAGRVFSAEDVRVAESLAAHAAVALENARLYTEAERRHRESELLATLGKVLTASLDLDAILKRLTEAARDLCGAELARIALWVPGEQAMAFRYTAGTRVCDTERLRLLPGQGLGGFVMETGRPYRTPDVRTDPRHHPDNQWLVEAEDHRAVLIVPIRSGSLVEGLIYAHRRTVRPFSERDESILLRLADHAAIALRNAALFAGEQRARAEAEAVARRSAVLADASRILGASLDYRGTLEALTRRLVPAFADWCVVHLVRHDESIRRIGPTFVDSVPARLADEITRLAPPHPGSPAHSVTLRILRSGQPLLVPEVSADWLAQTITDPAYLQAARELDPKSLMIVPMNARGRSLGVITLLRLSRDRRYGAADLSLAEDIANRAALAIDNARLYRQAERARAEAEATSRAKDDYLAMLGHELRNPLAAITNAVAVLGGPDPLDARTGRARDIIARQAGHLAGVVEDLLDVARLTSGKIVLKRRPVDLRDIVTRTVEAARLSPKGQRLTIALAAESVWVLADPVRIEQIVSNLLSNAVKYTPDGGAVRVDASANGSQAILRVADTGIGIAPDVLPRVFDLFTQGGRGLDRSQGGLGIGLTLVRRLVDLHEGTVTAESAGPGRGSLFTVRLPRVAAGAVVGQSATPAGDRPCRILVIEDNDDAREMLREMLELNGHEVRDAPNGAIGVGQALALRPDVAVVDIGLPGMDGYEVARRIRAAAEGRGIRLVALTGYGQAEDRRRAEQAGFDAHLVKPIEPGALAAVLRRLTTGPT